MIEKDDWRLQGQERYMKGAKMKRARFPEDSKSDHEHCAFCWAKFYTGDEDLKEGFCTLDAYRWVCEKCFEDFKDMFEWELVE